MLENDYKYELKYTHKDKVCNISFNGEITFDELVSNLQDFLYSCGWSEDTVKRQIKTESDLWEEVEDNKETDNSKRKDCDFEYYKAKIGEYDYKDNINSCHGYDPDKDYYKNTVNNE